MAAFLRTARVVAAPVDLGTGTPNKIFEAFEAGAAVVASAGVRRARPPGGEAVPARPPPRTRSSRELVGAISRIRPRAARDGAQGRAFVEAHADRRASVAAIRRRVRRAPGRAREAARAIRGPRGCSSPRRRRRRGGRSSRSSWRAPRAPAAGDDRHPAGVERPAGAPWLGVVALARWRRCGSRARTTSRSRR